MISRWPRWLAPTGSIACALVAITPAVAAIRGDRCTHDHAPTAELRGAVSTLEGRALAGAIITAHDADARLSTTVVSDTDGRYRFPSLGAGEHRVEVRLPGFVTKTERLTLAERAPRTLDVELRPGDDNVTAQRPPIQPSSRAIITEYAHAVAADAPHDLTADGTRFDTDGDGVQWHPAHTGNALRRFDPTTGALREFALPIRDAMPNVVRVDRRSGTVWIGTGAADALLSFDPCAERFEVHPLPTRGALVKHISIDPRSGAVWGAYEASTGTPPKIVRLELSATKKG